jgi:hypothetical protein
MKELLERSEELVAKVPKGFERYLSEQVDPDQRLIGVKGARGTGKSTMLLQWLHKTGLPPHRAAYFTLDDLYFATNSIVETAKDFYKQGGEFLVLDEVHKYPGWSQEIKNLYDLLPDLWIRFTGSSIIELSEERGDLSRRALMYELHGLSYREYLHLFHGIELPAFELEELLDQDKPFRDSFPEGFKPLVHFDEYLEHGYYPFFQARVQDHHQRLGQLVRTVVEYDMSEMKGFDIRNAKKMLRLLAIVAEKVPFTPNLSKLAQQSGVHRNSLSNYLFFLEKARLIWLLHSAGGNMSKLKKPEKLLLNNSNLLHALRGEPSIGTVRETFFCSQLQVGHRVEHPEVGDLLVDGRYLFEVAGNSKGKKQVAEQENAFIVKDDLEYPVGNSLPLWIFGVLY